MTLGTSATPLPNRDAEAPNGISLPLRSSIRRRSLVAMCGVLMAGGIAAGCGGGSGVASAPSSTAHETATQGTAAATAPTTTTTTSLPAQCGAPRDPLDPTNTPAPSPPAC